MKNIFFIKLKIYKYAIIFFVVFLISHFSSLIFPPKADAAEQSLRVSPVIINVSLSPGKTYTHEVTVENITNAPMPLRATLNDFITAGEEGGYVFEETKTNPLLSWIKISETEFIINPKEKKKLQMSITTPKSISLGGYYGILFFEPVLPTTTANGARVSSKVGVLMLANVGVTDPNAQKAEIIDFTMPLIDADGTLPALLRVKNISLNFFTAKPQLSITPLLPSFSQSPHSITLEDKIIFPGKIRRWEEQSVIHGLAPNIYKMQLAVATGNGQNVTTGSYVLVFPYEKALVASILITIAIVGITKRKRIRKALTALIAG
jgi:hypothetical protein